MNRPEGSWTPLYEGRPSEPVFEGGFSAPAYWARWEYSPEEWRRFDQLDWGAALRKVFLWIASIGLGCVMFIVCLGIVEVKTNSILDWPLFAIPLGFLLVPTLIVFALYISRHFLPARQRHRARLMGASRVTIGSPSMQLVQGVWLAGLYIPLQDRGLNLLAVEMHGTHPPLLRFRREHFDVNPPSQYRQAPWDDSIQLPIPAGHEAEAVQLIARFRMETIRPGPQPPPPPPAEPG